MASAALNMAPTREIKPPSALLALTELPRAIAEWGSLAVSMGALVATAPRGDGHPVLVLPGFMTSDTSTRVLRRFLRTLGYDAHTWNLGRNLGPRAIGQQGEKLVERLAGRRAVAARVRRPVRCLGAARRSPAHPVRSGLLIALSLATRPPPALRAAAR